MLLSLNEHQTEQQLREYLKDFLSFMARVRTGPDNQTRSDTVSYQTMFQTMVQMIKRHAKVIPS